MTPGIRVRDYEVWGRLGEGGMSEVWLAKHALLSIPVIIKTLRAVIPDIMPGDTRSALEGSATGASRMIKEARLMARVASPRVVRAIDAGVHEDTPYLVQEYVDGIDFAELDRRRRLALGVGLPLWFVAHALEETCYALHAGHQVGVIHRDVKPSNLFGDPEVGVRLGDFGLATTHDDGVDKEISGTIRFMAPEQLRGESLDRCTDVYGAGATACDLRYGHPPFEDITAALDGSIAPRFPRPHSPAEAYFQHMLGSMLARDRSKRPRDAAECARHFGMLARALAPRGSSRQGIVCVSKNEFRLDDCTVLLLVDDIASAKAEAIVSSANYELKMRAGVGNALRLAGGDSIEEEALRMGEQALGACVVTGAGKLAAKHVLHAVSAWNEASCVGRAMHRALLMADELGARSLALCAMGTGAARVSLETCANAMMSSLRLHIALGGSRLRDVKVYLGDESKLQIFREVAEEALRGKDESVPLDDLGLAAEEGEVRGDAATHLDPLTRSSLVGMRVR
jgi:O-acetyl-ADP-ribose deacetylase (regulator of RNase III)